MTALVTAAAGFLLAVLWFDLMFDVQAIARRGRGGAVSESALASISAYYRRVTTTAAPMSRLIGAVMLALVAAIGLEIAGGSAPSWAAWTSLGLASGSIALAASHTLPSARRLGQGVDEIAVQRRLARSICRDHLACLAAIAALLAIQLGFAR